MFRLALPVVIAEMGWMTMGMMDTLMVGPISPAAIGAVGFGSSIFMGICIFAMGLFLGLDTLVSHAFGARNLGECHRWLVHGIVLAIAYWVAISVFAALGTGGLVAPTLAAWAPNLLFGAGAGYLLLTVRT